ncbi:MAG TPA: hypothetical protein VGQ55_02900 [Pyrinomonadaceae bacterium]|jgi:hypothetical protein|nr:hypothetical protein [Pyrinomonadaceae bacterium]
MVGALRKHIFACVVFIAAFVAFASAQSTDQNFPSPVTSDELSGTINARDVGDARLTTYYYIFDVGQGDLFVNFLTKNFTGDIDIFYQDGLRPLSKIVMYADLAETETGRVLYLRKPERLLMRVQGRTPGDDPATYRIKFAGSFRAMNENALPGEPEAPKVTSTTETNVRVNSVGTILEIIPKAVPAKTEKKEVEAAKVEEKIEEPKAEEKPDVETPKKVEVVVSDNTPEAKVNEPKSPVVPGRRRTATPRPRPVRETASKTVKTPPPTRRTAVKKAPEVPKEPAPDPLENVQLVIEFKDGRSIKRPMSEVFRFTIDKGTLTVISKDGSIGRYSLLDVASVTIK